MHKQTWHHARPNLGDRIHRSFELRYQPPRFYAGRDYYPGFLARSATESEKLLSSPSDWATLWNNARIEVVNGLSRAVFNERWNHTTDTIRCAPAAEDECARPQEERYCYDITRGI